MRIRPLRVALPLVALTVTLANACSAQPPAGDTQKQLDALRTQVNAMQKDLDEIKALLAPLRARQAQADKVTIDLGPRPVKGDASARLTLVELTDYQ